MRNGVLMLAGALIALIAGVLLYQGFAQREDQKQLLSDVRLQSESTRYQLDRLAADQSAIRKTVTQTHDAVAAATDPSNVAMRSDVASVAGIRTAISEYYQTTMKLPSSNEDAGLLAPDQYRGTVLRSATVNPDGQVDLVFGAVSDSNGGRMRLVPDVAGADATGVHWRCETGDYPLIAQIVPGCEYRSGSPAVTDVPAKSQ